MNTMDTNTYTNTNINTKLIFNRIEFENCLLNASGCHCTDKNELVSLYKSNCGGFVSKSCSRVKQDGNPERPRYFDWTQGSINSMGLPNMGSIYYIDLMKQFTEKPYIISVASNFLADNFNILYDIELYTTTPRLVEINVSCPNIPGKEQLAYNFAELEKFLFNLSRHKSNFTNLIIGLKLPPYFDPVHFERLRDTLNLYIESKNIKFLTAINSIGNGLVIDGENETTAIKPKMGLGGLGGDVIKPTALANVWQLYNIFEDRIPIIACGGVKNGMDAFEHILCGASLVQVGSQLIKEGPNCFARIDKELREIMNKKGYLHINDFRGKLKYGCLDK